MSDSGRFHDLVAKGQQEASAAQSADKQRQQTSGNTSGSTSTDQTASR